MYKRRFADLEAQVTFKKNWTQTLVGTLKPGTTLHVWYDAERLPHERSLIDGKPAWLIDAFVKFTDDPDVHTFPLWVRGGTVLTKVTNETDGGTMMICEIPVPEYAHFVTIWFMNTGASGDRYFDSAYGANYTYRFSVIDIQDLDANVTTSMTPAHSRFEASLTATPEVSMVSIAYQVLNVRPQQSGKLALQRDPSGDGNGRLGWSGNCNVPLNAVIAFEVEYVIAALTFVDDNSAQSFLAPRPGTTEADLQAKFAASVKQEDPRA